MWVNEIIFDANVITNTKKEKLPCFYSGQPVSAAIENALSSDSFWLDETKEILSKIKGYFLQKEESLKRQPQLRSFFSHYSQT